MKKVKRDCGILTIGHSSHEITRFLELLEEHQIEVVVDVRSTPYSRWQPQFNRETLAKSLKPNDIVYEFLGTELGARSNDSSCYKDGRVQYRLLANTELFQVGIQRILALCKDQRIVMMCAEKDPLDCHRTILVSRELINVGEQIDHIIATGETESHMATMRRLQKQIGQPDFDLFRSDKDLLDEAYSIQEKKIAYSSDD